MRIHGGRDCRFESLFENVHRGMYLAGIDDCEIRATGKNAWTGVGAMITCAKMNGSLRGASNIIATIVDTGTIRNNNSEPLPVHLEITSAGDKVDGGLFRRSDHLEFLNIDVDYLASVFTNSMVICPVRFTGSDFVDKDGRDNVPEDIVQVECKMRVCRMNSNMWNAQAGINQVIYILQYWHRNVISDYSIELSSDDNVMSFVGYIAPHKNLFDELGNETGRFRLTPGGLAPGTHAALQIPIGQYHTIRSLESGTVIIAFKNGRYEEKRTKELL